MSSYSRLISFADRAIIIEAQHPDGCELIEHIFEDVADHATVKAHGRFCIRKTEQTWSLEYIDIDSPNNTDTQTLYRGESRGDLSSILVGETIYHLTDRCDSGIVLHAAAVTRDGITIALPANSGSGKTTLAAWLVSCGWQYLTDELVHIPLGTEQLRGFTRPYNFKRPAYSLIKSEFGLDTDANYALTGSFASLIAHRELAQWSAPPPLLELTHVVFPRYTAGHEGALTQLSAARAGLSLMECLVNARNLPQHGFDEIGRLVRRIKPMSFEYGSFDIARDQLLPALQ